MKKLIQILTFCAMVVLIGCANPFEAKTCGIKNSQWQMLSSNEKLEIEKSYHEQQRLADQLRVNKLLLKQQKKLAKARKQNEKKQMQRLKQERLLIEKQQHSIEKELSLKQQSFINIE